MTEVYEPEHDDCTAPIVIELLDLDDGDGDDAGDRLGLAVDAAGESSIWFMRPLCPTHEATAQHGDASTATHERSGPLPALWAHRLAAVPFRCCRPAVTMAGRPCRIVVEHPGDTCGYHRGGAQ